MPEVSRSDNDLTWFLDFPLTIGWHWPKSGDPTFVIVRRKALGGIRIEESFPLTEDGWQAAWQSFAAISPAPSVASVAAKIDAERERLLRVARKNVPPDATFPALGIEVRGDIVETIGYWSSNPLGSLAGAEVRLTDGSQAWSPGRAAFLPIGLAGLATKTKATAFVIFADGTYHQTELNDNRSVRDAQAEAIRFNLMAGTLREQSDDTPREDVATTLRNLASLHHEGLLTDEEYAAKHAEVIGRI